MNFLKIKSKIETKYYGVGLDVMYAGRKDAKCAYMHYISRVPPPLTFLSSFLPPTF